MLKAAARGEGNKTLVEDPNAKPCCCPRKVSKLALLWPCWEGAGAAGAMSVPGTAVSLRCTLTSARVFRGTRCGGTHVTACAFPHSHEPGAEHTQHGSLAVLVPGGTRVCGCASPELSLSCACTRLTAPGLLEGSRVCKLLLLFDFLLLLPWKL